MGIRKKANKLNFVLFFDQNYLNLFDYFLYSLNENYNVDEEINFFIGTDDKTYGILQKRKKDNFFIEKTSSFLEGFSNENLFGNITTQTYSRLFIDKIFFKNLKILKKGFIYLDVDTLIKKRIPREVFRLKANIAFSNNYFKFDLEKSYNFWEKRFSEIDSKLIKQEIILKKIEEFNYFNAGVIFINKPKLFFKLTKRIVKIGLENISKFDDQTLLNYFNKREIKIVSDYRFNYFVSRLPFHDENIYILHFIGNKNFLMKEFLSKNWKNILKKYIE